MNELVINMLEQSLYASGTKAPEKDSFSVKEMIEEFLKSAEPIFREKGIAVNYKVDDALVFGDRKQLTTVLSNIVLNAVSHAAGEKRIDITTRREDGLLKVVVFNTGSFIADKDKDGIFTSFYRADKAHSRKEGRFGLGLSIVKSIVTNHGCDCGFENKNDGVAFWFTVEIADIKEGNYEKTNDCDSVYPGAVFGHASGICPNCSSNSDTEVFVYQLYGRLCCSEDHTQQVCADGGLR
jgi:K+-sensing histidine kinase KdpD